MLSLFTWMPTRCFHYSMPDFIFTWNVVEEFIKFAHINREYADFPTNRYSERKELAERGILLTQAEKEAAKDAAKAKAKANE